MSVTRASFVDDSGETRFAGTIGTDADVSAGDVLTAQGDGTTEWGGGSIPDPVTTQLNIAPTDDTLSDLETITAPVGYGSDSMTGYMLRLSDGTTDVAIIDVYGGFTLLSPTGDDATLNVKAVDGSGNVVSLASGHDGAVSCSVMGTGSHHTLSVDGAGVARAGFFGAVDTTQPVVPMTTPSAQDIIDALVALGLVAQHD